MSKVEINFNDLKYNLYELLNVPPDADATKIKKNFMKIIKNFHPDKNSELEDEIYYNIILANQILLDKETRRKYDEFINGTAETFNDLKNSFNKSVKEIEHFFPAKNNSMSMFNAKIEELNKKHGYDENKMGFSVMEKFSKVREKRNTDKISIEKEDIRNIEEFNKKFNSNKLDGGKFRDQIVEYKGIPQELSTYIIGEQYTSLHDIDKLYIEDSVQSSKYSSLDRAFTLQPVTNNNNNITVDDRMNEYKNQTEQFKNMKPTDFSTRKFNEW